LNPENYDVAMFLAVLLICAATLYRLLPHPDNFAPLSAIAICGGMYLSRRMSLIVVLGMVLVTDFSENLLKHHGTYGIMPFEALGHYVGFLAAILLGWWIRPHKNVWTVTGGTIAASCLFYLITNFVCWIDNPLYPKTLAGLLQCYTVGTPGWPSTISFFLKTLASDLIFTGLFVAAAELAARGLPRTRFEWLLAKV
jgi:uncharacterized protein DUF6580